MDIFGGTITIIEHDTTSLAIGIVKYLAKNYGKDKRITKLLNEKEVYIIPMMNPDGVEYDLSGEVKPFTWRKNRKPINEKNYGVDLNRNWGYKWDVVPEELKEQYYNPNNDYYHGEKPFSEDETTAIRNFLLSHNNIKIFIDYHSGSAPFLQGGIGFPFAYSEKELLTPEKKRYKEIAHNFSALVSNPNDKRKDFIVSQARDGMLGRILKSMLRFTLSHLLNFFSPSQH